MQVIQGMALMKMKWDALSRSTQSIISDAAFFRAAHWATVKRLHIEEVATLLYSLSLLETSWIDLAPSMKSGYAFPLASHSLAISY